MTSLFLHLVQQIQNNIASLGDSFGYLAMYQLAHTRLLLLDFFCVALSLRNSQHQQRRWQHSRLARELFGASAVYKEKPVMFTYEELLLLVALAPTQLPQKRKQLFFSRGKEFHSAPRPGRANINKPQGERENWRSSKSDRSLIMCAYLWGLVSLIGLASTAVLDLSSKGKKLNWRWNLRQFSLGQPAHSVEQTPRTAIPQRGDNRYPRRRK